MLFLLLSRINQIGAEPVRVHEDMLIPNVKYNLFSGNPSRCLDVYI
jgi:hypothetical protein